MCWGNSSFEPMRNCSLLHMSLKTSFLITINSARRVGDLGVFRTSPRLFISFAECMKGQTVSTKRLFKCTFYSNWSPLRCVPVGAPLPACLPFCLGVFHWTFVVERIKLVAGLPALYIPSYLSTRMSGMQGQTPRHYWEYLQSRMHRHAPPWCGVPIGTLGQKQI